MEKQNTNIEHSLTPAEPPKKQILLPGKSEIKETKPIVLTDRTVQKQQNPVSKDTPLEAKNPAAQATHFITSLEKIISGNASALNTQIKQTSLNPKAPDNEKRTKSQATYSPVPLEGVLPQHNASESSEHEESPSDFRRGKLFSKNYTPLEGTTSGSDDFYAPENTLYANRLFSDKTMIEHYGLKQNPFGDSLDTTFFYKSRQHHAALINMLMTIEQDISFGLIYGKSGTGKTLISQAILENLSRTRFLPVLVPVIPGFSRSAFLKILLTGFGCDISKINRNINDMLTTLQDLILASYNAGIKPVIMIDECHFLSCQALHILRTLTNFEAFNKKLITCILFAEENFMRRLRNPSFASLCNRIYLEIELSRLTRQECTDYIKFRLMVAGNEKADLFSDLELGQIFERSKGIPRNINKECTKILLERYTVKKLLKSNRNKEAITRQEDEMLLFDM